MRRSPSLRMPRPQHHHHDATTIPPACHSARGRRRAARSRWRRKEDLEPSQCRRACRRWPIASVLARSPRAERFKFWHSLLRSREHALGVGHRASKYRRLLARLNLPPKGVIGVLSTRAIHRHPRPAARRRRAFDADSLRFKTLGLRPSCQLLTAGMCSRAKPFGHKEMIVDSVAVDVHVQPPRASNASARFVHP